MKKRYTFKTKTEETPNIFALDDPDLYRCRVNFIHPLHRGTRLHISRDSTSELPFHHFFLSLSLVKYFDGPMQWEGANFSVASAGEFAALFSKLNAIAIAEEQALSSHWCLLKIQTSTVLVRLICKNEYTIS